MWSESDGAINRSAQKTATLRGLKRFRITSQRPEFATDQGVVDVLLRRLEYRRRGGWGNQCVVPATHRRL
jgi:hypothetical protein